MKHEALGNTTKQISEHSNAKETVWETLNNYFKMPIKQSNVGS